MSEECSVMEIKRKHWSADPDDSESSNENRYESDKQQMKKMKMSEDDVACNVPENSHLPLKIMYSVIKKKVGEESMPRPDFKEYENKANAILFLKNIQARAEERLREGCSNPIDVLSMHLVEPCLVLESLAVQDLEYLRMDIKVYLELDRATPTSICYWEALLVVCDWEIGKKEALIRAMLRGEQSSVELLGKERGLLADVENLLRGNNRGRLELLQSKIELRMPSGSANVEEYWGTILKCIRLCKAKACLNEIHSKILSKGLEKGIETEAGGTGSSCSTGLLHGEAFSSNNDEIIPNQCRRRELKYCNTSVNTDSERNNCNKTHYDIIMAHYNGYD